MSGPGRRAGQPNTRAEIVDAAREAFSDAGYNGASIRRIAEGAGVDPSLVYHYFSGKEELFAASISLPVSPRHAIGAAFDAPTEQIGRNLARIFIEIWSMDGPREALLGIIRSTVSGNRRASAAIRQLIMGEIIAQMERVSPGPDVQLRALGIVSQLIGVAIVRYVVEMDPFASASADELVDLIAPRIQTYITG